eukprot:g996.t1
MRPGVPSNAIPSAAVEDMVILDNPTVVAVDNLPYASTEAEILRDLVEGVCMRRPMSVHKIDRGLSLITLSDRGQADGMVRELHGHSYRGRRLTAVVKEPAYTERRKVKRWSYVDVTASTALEQRAANASDLQALYDRIPEGEVRTAIEGAVAERQQSSARAVLKEIYLALGRHCELVFTAGSGGKNATDILRSDEVCALEHIESFLPMFEDLPADLRRTGIDETLHRISRTVHAVKRETTAITARVGRSIQGHVVPMLLPSPGPADDQAASDALAGVVRGGLLLIGPPNVGKTTVLRELARVLSGGRRRVVVVVDKSLEIAGTGAIPHPAIGNARVLTVTHPRRQHEVMLEAVENQSPDVVVVDELSTREEAAAARTISGRGVAVIATVHGESLTQIVHCPERSMLVGGVTSVTLSGREATGRADRRRQVQKRCGPAVFSGALELRGFSDWIHHDDVEKATDALLDFEPTPATWLHQAQATSVAKNFFEGGSAGGSSSGDNGDNADGRGATKGKEAATATATATGEEDEAKSSSDSATAGAAAAAAAAAAGGGGGGPGGPGGSAAGGNKGGGGGGGGVPDAWRMPKPPVPPTTIATPVVACKAGTTGADLNYFMLKAGETLPSGELSFKDKDAAGRPAWKRAAPLVYRRASGSPG